MDASQAGEGHEEYSFASDSLWNEARAVLTALISAFRYGLKIRLPHALVMTFMFRRDLSTQGKLRVILRAVAEHATSLGSFAFIYKVTLFFLKYLHRRYGNLMIDTLKDPTRSHSLGRILMSMIGEFENETIIYPTIFVMERKVNSIPSFVAAFFLWILFSSAQ